MASINFKREHGTLSVSIKINKWRWMSSCLQRKSHSASEL
jgi:hypothetical protein